MRDGGIQHCGSRPSASSLSPAGQVQVATALELLEALEARMGVVRQQLLDAARHLAGAKVLAELGDDALTAA